MTSTVIVHAYVDGTETSGVALVTVDQLIWASYHKSCYAPCTLTDLPDNSDFEALVTYPDQPYQSQVFSTGVGTTTTLNFYFSVSIKGTLTVWGYWDGQEVPVQFTIDGVAGGPWTTNIKLELDAGTYTVRGTWLQQTKVYSATVTAGQNTDLIIQMEKSAYGYVTVESDYQAHVDISDSAGNVIYSLTLPPIPKPEGGYRYGITVVLLPDTYHVHGTYDGQVADQDVTIAAGEGKLVTLTFTFLVSYTLSISCSTGGTTTPSGDQTVLEGTIITVTAIANTGYRFAGWTLDGVDAGVANPIAVTMDSNHGLFANFTKITGGELPVGWILMGIALALAAALIGYYAYTKS